jgi:hypothetical protein
LFDLLARVFAFGVQALFVPEFILRALPHIRSERLRRFRPVISGLFLALPLVLVLGLLLISADSVFASVFSVSIDVGGLPLHVFLFVVGAWFASTVMRAASCSYDGVHGSRAIMGFTESIVVVGAMVVLYAAFVATQIVVWAGGAQHVLQTSGLTYAEHARRGFFQLVVVGAITLVVLTTLRGTAAQAADRQVRIWQGISLLAVLLTLVIVGVAIQRLFLYEDAYGLTMLRLYATLFAFWIGVVFVLYAVTLFLRTDNRWFFGASVAFGMASLLAMNVVNPEALVVHRNIDRANTAVVPLDMDYLGTLSDDGLAAIVSSFDGLDATQQQAFVTSVCSGFDSGSDHSGFSYNRSRAQVASFRTGHCTQ